MTTASATALTTITSTSVAFPTPNYLPGLTSIFTPAPACFWQSYDINPTDGLDVSSSGTIFKGVTSWCYPPTFYGSIPGPTEVSTTSDGTALAVATVTMALYSPAMCPYGYVTVSESVAHHSATVGGSATATATTYATCCPASHSINSLGGPCTSLASGASASITVANSNITTTTMVLQNQQVVIAASPVIVAWQANDLTNFITTSTTTSVPSFTPTFIPPPTYPSLSSSVTTVTAQAADHHGTNLSPGAAAGIGVGVGVGTLALLFAGLLFWRRHRQRSSAEQPDDPHRAEKGERLQVPTSNGHAAVAASTHTTTTSTTAEDHNDDDVASKDRQSTG